jgi:hypothetical protein
MDNESLELGLALFLDSDISDDSDPNPNPMMMRNKRTNAAWLPITVLLCYFFGSFTGANPVIDSKKQCHITHYATTANTVALAHPYLQ